VRDVDGRHHLVRLRPAGLCGFGVAIGERTNQIMITSAEVAAKAPFLPIKITGGVLADEAVRLFRKWSSSDSSCAGSTSGAALRCTEKRWRRHAGAICLTQAVSAA
jgi:hypothetical protein